MIKLVESAVDLFCDTVGYPNSPRLLNWLFAITPHWPGSPSNIVKEYAMDYVVPWKVSIYNEGMELGRSVFSIGHDEDLEDLLADIFLANLSPASLEDLANGIGGASEVFLVNHSPYDPRHYVTTYCGSQIIAPVPIRHLQCMIMAWDIVWGLKEYLESRIHYDAFHPQTRKDIILRMSWKGFKLKEIETFQDRIDYVEKFFPEERAETIPQWETLMRINNVPDIGQIYLI